MGSHLGLGPSGFPQRQDGFPFYDAPIIADVGAGGGHRNAIEANDNYWIHAWGPDGTEAPGFPKYTGQWTGFVGTVGDPRMNGHLALAYGTREGTCSCGTSSGSSGLNNSWWHYRHDEWNTGQYGLDTRPPAAGQPPARPAPERQPGGAQSSLHRATTG